MLMRSFRPPGHSLAPLMTFGTAWLDAPSSSGREYSGGSTDSRRGGPALDAAAPSCSGREHRYYSNASPKPLPSGTSFEEAFKRNPHNAAQQLAAKLSPAQRAVLASALAQQTEVQQLDEKYWEELFKAHDNADGDSPGALSREEFQAAMLAHTSLIENRNRIPPSASALKMVFLASAIPFVAFGFLDNAIMLVAGEEIDHMFGIRLGLSTLASAGLGNAVADVIGVGAAKYIEQAVRWLPFVREPKLSKFQNALPSTQRAKLAGAMVGVLVGCLMGLTPLFMSGSFFTR
ncbi:hypothetical protein Agub_g1839 [Astrephomene gubernaculifera]|uniref:Transmembrane protein 65 n=1 Tax=Astrephomene gubernaculifera TaxID=47775 RepID=A0AAD3DGL3_9CHLO|nr:hypothetical protein Agub_g1839 [Astrephomene gubernaculifera]